MKVSHLHSSCQRLTAHVDRGLVASFPDGQEPFALTDFQVQVAQVFFSLPNTASLIGPTFAPEELAGRKVVGLLDRAEARDFADVFELSEQDFRDALLAQAFEVDRGFDHAFFAQMLRSVGRFSDADLPAPEAHIASMRDFFATWADQLDT